MRCHIYLIFFIWIYAPHLYFSPIFQTRCNGDSMDWNKDSFLEQVALAFPMDFQVFMTTLAQWLMLSTGYQIFFPIIVSELFHIWSKVTCYLFLKLLARPTWVFSSTFESNKFYDGIFLLQQLYVTNTKLCWNIPLGYINSCLYIACM